MVEALGNVERRSCIEVQQGTKASRAVALGHSMAVPEATCIEQALKSSIKGVH